MFYKIILEAAVGLLLGACTVTDLLWRKIWLPLLLAVLPVIVIGIVGMGEGVEGHFICGIICGTVFIGMSAVTRGQIEKGDGMVLGVMGLALGFWRSAAFLFLSFFYAFLAALFLVVIRKRGRAFRMPFMPFALAGYLTLLLAEHLG